MTLQTKYASQQGVRTVIDRWHASGVAPAAAMSAAQIKSNSNVPMHLVICAIHDDAEHVHLSIIT